MAQTVILRENRQRALAKQIIDRAPINAVVTIREETRNADQNDRMWAMLTDVATQVKWHGLVLGAEDWKLIFLAGLNREIRIVPNIDGTGFVNLSRSSSDLDKSEMTDLIELIFAFGANPDHFVEFHDPESIAARAKVAA